MIRQFNCGFDTFYGRILAPHTKNTINFLQKYLGGFHKNPPPTIKTAFIDVAAKYVTKLDPQNKNDETIKVYYILFNLFEKLRKSNIPFENLINPNDIKTYTIFRTYFIQYLELVETTHQDEFECNKYIYDYLINGKEIEDDIWIIENQNNPNVRMISIPGKEIRKYLEDRQLGMTLTGTLFYTHEHHLGLFSNFLKNLA